MLHTVNTADQKSRERQNHQRVLSRESSEGFSKQIVKMALLRDKWLLHVCGVQARPADEHSCLWLGAAPTHKLPRTVCFRSWENHTHRPYT